MEVPEDELLEGSYIIFLPLSATKDVGVTGAASTAVDGVERDIIGGVILIDDVMVDPFVIIDHGAKELLKLLLFLRIACPMIFFQA